MKVVIEQIGGLLLFRAEGTPPVPQGRATSLPPCDSEDMGPGEKESGQQSEPSDLGWGEGQSFFISYRDAQGQASERRITVESISLSARGIPLIHAWCHERDDERCFRLDRISEVVTIDGEVFRPPGRFFVESFGMSPVLANCGVPRRVCLKRILECSRHHMIVLAHMGRTDGEFILEEQGIILDHCLGMAEAAGIPVTEVEEDALRRHVRCLRPSRAMAVAAGRELENDPPKLIASLMRALRDVINADGIVHPKESQFLDDLTAELLGEIS